MGEASDKARLNKYGGAIPNLVPAKLLCSWSGLTGVFSLLTYGGYYAYELGGTYLLFYSDGSYYTGNGGATGCWNGTSFAGLSGAGVLMTFKDVF